MTTPSGPPQRPPPHPSSPKDRIPLGAALLLVLPLLLGIAYLGWANHLPPPIQDHRVLPRPNGFDAVVRAVGKLHKTPNDSPLAHPSRADPGTLRRLLAPDQAALVEVRQAMRLDYMTPALHDARDEFPYLARYRDAARKFAATSRVALADGRAGAAMESALDAVELGSRAGRGGGVIHHLVGIACTAIGAAQAERCVERLSASEARASGRRLDRIMAQYPPPVEALEEDRRTTLNTLRLVFHGQIDIQDLAEETDDPSQRRDLRGFWFVYPKPWSYGAMDRGFQAHMREIRKPYRDRKVLPRPKEMFAAILLPIYNEFGFKATENEVTLRLVRMQLALAEYRGRFGRYPVRLDELAPAILPSVPVDPFSSRPWIYRPPGAGYTLYSVGPDGVDNGGTAVPMSKLKRGKRGDVVAGRLYSSR